MPSCPDVRTLRPMLATLADAPLQDRHLVYEPKYDGIRGLVEIVPRGRTADVRLFSRLGNEKSAQFPELVHALVQFGAKLSAPVIVDGEIVALDAHGQPAGFQRLQGRIHLTSISEAEAVTQPVALIAFDLLCENGQSLCELSLTERRARLVRVFAKARGAKKDPYPALRLSDVVTGDGRALYDEAQARGWEGLIVKHADSLYRPGRRTTDWRKLKLVRRQEFVVAGWTEPRSSRSHFGALLLGYYRDGALTYAGHTGSGFDERELTRVFQLMRPLETERSPFKPVPKTNERPHWIAPSLVAEVKFTEWTDEGLLRHPIYLGLRKDVKAENVRREPTTRLPVMTAKATGPALTSSKPKKPAQKPSARPRPVSDATHTAELKRLHDDLQRMEADHGDGVILLPGNVKMSVTNLKKIFWPKLQITKGELLRYYVKVAPYLLPVVEDRPLVMKRFPNGVGGKDFYQHRAPETVPEGVRVETVEGDTDVPARFIGGSLLTLLHMTQLAAISQDPWFSRVQSTHMADHAAIDLDPGDGVSFARILDTARWVRDELETLGVRGFPKTSGADGLHIYIPLEPETPYEAGMLFCQIVATIVAQKHPKVATVERKVRARGQTVYVDYLQNIEGKTLACAYSARASEYAGASTPLTWKEIDEGVDPRDFTIRTLPARLEQVGDLWSGLRKAKGTNLRVVEKYARE
jgi:bifunctional non-homologous end joining protein LigD